MKEPKRWCVFVCALTLIWAAGLGTAGAAADTLRVAFVTDARTVDPGTATRDYTGYASIGAI